MTVSRTTRVTMPVSRLRADDDRVVPGLRRLAQRRRDAGQVGAVHHGRAAARPREGRRPLSIQRRTVSSLTPSSAAASAIR